jgi:hypothetical protein
VGLRISEAVARLNAVHVATCKHQPSQWAIARLWPACAVAQSMENDR